MATTEDDGGLGAEVTSRLDELFSEEDDYVDNNPVAQQDNDLEEKVETPAVLEPEESMDESEREDSRISNLKALVSEIEWEITDQTMRSFLNEVSSLKQKHQDDPVLLMYLRLHESIGKYIKARKVRAHPEAIKFVASVFSSFEKVIKSPGMPMSQKKKLLSSEMRVFKDLKDKLVSRKEITTKSAAPFDGKMPTAPVKLENREAIDYLAEYILRKLKSTIKEEFEILKRTIEKSGS